MADILSQSDTGSTTDSKKPLLCEECKENRWKYRCPGCGLLTCSLLCVKSHKERLGCTGKRPRTEFVPIAQFNDDTILSDYNFLEETKRVAEAARRIRAGFGGKYSGFLPQRLQMLRKAAYKRGIRLYYLPKGMSKRESNQSYFDRRKKCIFWTIEWRFHSAHSTLKDHNVPETERVEKLIDKHLSPTPWNDNLTSYRNVPLAELKFFIQRSAKTSKSSFRELDIKLPICSQLRSVLILEHPVVHVYLPTETPNFDIEICAKPKITKDKDEGLSYQEKSSLAEDSAPKGSIYKEEEIEEGDTESETFIVDLSENAAQNNKFSGEVSMQNFSAVVSPAKDGSQGGSHLDNSIDGMIEIKGLDFDDEVGKAYSDLIGEMDPDDFLCFDDDGFINNVHNYNNNIVEIKEEGIEEEIEEGEIPA